MSLIGAKLLVLLAAAAVGLPVLTLLTWERLARARLGCRLARCGLLLACQLAAVLLVAAAANDYGYFYGSWSELLGRTGGSPVLVRQHPTGLTELLRPGTPLPPPGTGHRPGAARPAAAHAQVIADVPWSPATLWSKRGRVVQLYIGGGPSGLAETALVYLPPQYLAPAGQHRDFPAVEVFTGYPGTTQNLLSRLKYPEMALQQVNAGAARPMVLVMLRPSVTYPRDTECTDVPKGPSALDFFTTEVPDAVSAALRVQRQPWGAIGDSTGGYCAAKAALMAPARFRAAVTLSGYFHALQDSTTGELWGKSTAVRNSNDLVWRLYHLPQPGVALLLASSRAERGPDGYSASQELAAAATAPLTVDQLQLPAGGHNFRSWRRELPAALAWLSQHLTPTTPAPRHEARRH